MPARAPADVYRDFARFYDVYVGDFLADLPIYLRYARRARTPIIEIGAGSGRLTLPLARAGHEVVAVDISRAMLGRLRARLRREPATVRRRVRLVWTDAAHLAVGMRSDLIIVPFYTFNYFLDWRGREAALRRLAHHLTGPGRLLIDVFIPLARIADPPREPVLRVDVGRPSRPRLRGWNRYVLDVRRQLETRYHLFVVETADGRVRHHRFITRRRWWHTAELRRMFRRHGFRIEAVLAGYRQRRARGDAEQLLWVLRR